MKVLNFTLKNGASLTFMFALALLFFISEPAFAGLGSLEKGTTAIEDIGSWLQKFTIAGSLVYITYLVVMALAEKKAWSDVMMGLGYCAIAGGVVMAGTWATELWG